MSEAQETEAWFRPIQQKIAKRTKWHSVAIVINVDTSVLVVRLAIRCDSCFLPAMMSWLTTSVKLSFGDLLAFRFIESLDVIDCKLHLGLNFACGILVVPWPVHWFHDCVDFWLCCNVAFVGLMSVSKSAGLKWCWLLVLLAVDYLFVFVVYLQSCSLKMFFGCCWFTHVIRTWNLETKRTSCICWIYIDVAKLK